MKISPEVIRIALKAVTNGRPVPVSASDLVDHLGLTKPAEKKRLHNILSELQIRGEIERKSPGLYQVVFLKKPPLKTIMWRLLKMRRTVTAEDLVGMSGATRSYVDEWMRLLHKREIVKRTGPGRYKLINDDVEEPEATIAAARMRKLRAVRRKAQAPAEAVFEPDSVVMAAANLNRLICSGLAVRNADSAREAMSHVQVITEAVKGVIDEE
ncbi:MAG: hypothetical protein K9K21_02930 [Desulfotignum sp.]|nr:hypothetical protein [Desulfotignum sp.]